MTTVFFSYSHHDEALRNQLETHLAQLRREGLVESWHDRRIDAGDELHGAIGQNLENADIILLLISPYFLASDYCCNVEMQRAMQRHKAGNARVIPVILEPCDWHTALFGNLKAVPTDGRPITKFPNVHDGLLEVVKAIRAIVQPSNAIPVIQPQNMHTAPSLPAARPEIRSSNLMVHKSFTDHDRDKFLEEAFEYISSYFEGSLSELEKRNSEITTRFRRIDSNRFAAFIYRNGKSVCECSVSFSGLFGKAITYSTDANATNSMNDQLSVGDDGVAMFLKSMGFGGTNSKSLTLEGAAETFWTNLMRRIQS